MNIKEYATLSNGESSDASAAIVRNTLNDLRWAIDSPVLCGNHPPLFAEWAHDKIGPDLIKRELCNLRRIPIGRYFEALVHAWLSNRKEVTHLSTNIRIKKDRTTLGEADLLFNADGRSHHWELAIKFYLGTGDRLSTGDWFGPKGRDRLDLKLGKLKTQLQLMERPEAQSVLTECGLKRPESHALIKGYLFHPYTAWQKGHRPAPNCVNREHAHGWWIHHSDATKIVSRSNYWRCLEKHEWLARASGSVTIHEKDLASRLHNYFEDDDRPLMLAALDNVGNEMERGFIVPDHWIPCPR